MDTKRSRTLFSRALDVLPGGVDSPVRAFKAVGADPLFIRRAHGSRLEDVDGNTYIDYVMSWGPLIHGHAPSGLIKAVVRAARAGTSYGAPSPLEVALAERVRRLMPSLERVRFVNSGTEAAMSAVRVEALAGVRPALTCLGKIIGGGLPVGAYGGRADLMDLVSPAGPVYQAGTLSGNPLAMTAGLWCLDRLTPKLYRDLAALGGRLASGLADAARDAGVALQVNAFGSLLTPFFSEGPVRDYRSARAADTDRYARFFRSMLARGVYLPPSQFEAWFLSAAHTARDVDRTIAAARKAMKEAKQVGSSHDQI